MFLVHPQNGLNGLILNWCIGGYWFIPERRPSLKEPSTAMTASLKCILDSILWDLGTEVGDDALDSKLWDLGIEVSEDAFNGHGVQVSFIKAVDSRLNSASRDVPMSSADRSPTRSNRNELSQMMANGFLLICMLWFLFSISWWSQVGGEHPSLSRFLDLTDDIISRNT